jgi:hypothetical protein
VAPRRAAEFQNQARIIRPINLDQHEATKRVAFGSSQTARRAEYIVDNAPPELLAAVDSGNVAVSLAAKTLRHIQQTGQAITSIADLKETMRTQFFVRARLLGGFISGELSRDKSLVVVEVELHRHAGSILAEQLVECHRAGRRQ